MGGLVSKLRIEKRKVGFVKIPPAIFDLMLNQFCMYSIKHEKWKIFLFVNKDKFFFLWIDSSTVNTKLRIWFVMELNKSFRLKTTNAVGSLHQSLTVLLKTCCFGLIIDPVWFTGWFELFFFDETAFYRSKSASLSSHPGVICLVVLQQQEDRPLNHLEHLHQIVRYWIPKA